MWTHTDVFVNDNRPPHHYLFADAIAHAEAGMLNIVVDLGKSARLGQQVGMLTALDDHLRTNEEYFIGSFEESFRACFLRREGNMLTFRI